MKTNQITKLLMAALLLAPAFLAAAETPAYEAMAEHYEAIRLALLGDSLDGVNVHAAAIEELAGNLVDDFSPENAGVAEAEVGKLEVALREIGVAASTLSSAGDLAAARDDFFSLTKPMARYRKLTGSTGTVVAYCSMAQKAWIQPEGELGNPYMGQKMPRCGEIVGE
jgi:hypothetical protein